MSPFDRPIHTYLDHTPIAEISADAQLTVALEKMNANNASCLGAVGADGRLVGVISRTDLIRVSRLRAALAGGTRLMSFGHQRVRDRLTPAVIVVDRDATLRHAARQMVTARVHQIAVVEAGRMVGMLSVGDIIAAVAEEKIDLPLASCMTLPVITVDASDSLANAIDRLIESRVHGLVVTESTWPVGIFGQNEALDAAGLDPHHRVEEAMSCAMLCLPARTPLWRAAELAVDTGAQRILAIVNRELRGIATGLDLARVAAGLD